MQSFSVSLYTIALVLVSMQKITFGYAGDETCQRTNRENMITSFLKIPWLDFNSSWTEELTFHCRNDLTELFASADDGEMWALQMLDAASKIPSGILMGNIVDLGAYDQCVRVEHHHNSSSIRGQHCMVSLSIPSRFVADSSATLSIQKIALFNPNADVDPSLTLSVCLPSSCSVEDVDSFVNASIQTTREFNKYEISLTHVKCSGIDSADDLTMGTILVISFAVAVLSVLLSCTVCDFVVRAKSEDASMALKTLAKFSLYTNAIRLLSTEVTPETMSAVHGIRFLSTCLIVTAHRSCVTLLNPLVNLSDVYKFQQSVVMSVFMMISFVVDTFFVISGFLVTYLFMKRMRSGSEFNIWNFYLHRYIRLTPGIGALMLFVVFIIPYIGSGPIWQACLGNAIHYCQNNWWANLLHIHNLVYGAEMCIPHTWYVATDMQFYLLSPIVLYPLLHRPKLGLTILSLLLIASLITPAYQILANDYSFIFDITKNRMVSYANFFKSYTMTDNRALPYLLGILLGYDTATNQRKITKMQAASYWILTCIFILLCFRNTYYIQPNAPVYNAISEAVQASLGRLGWSLAMAWILYACTQGYGGPVTRILSLPIFAPLSRISFGIYLVHFIIQVGGMATRRTAEFFTISTAMHMVWGDLVMSIMVAFLLNICIETPIIILGEAMIAKRLAVTMNRVDSIQAKSRNSQPQQASVQNKRKTKLILIGNVTDNPKHAAKFMKKKA